MAVSILDLDLGIQHGSQRWDDGRTPAEALKDLGVASLSAKDAARLHSNLRATQMKVVAARLRWESLLRETDTVRTTVHKVSLSS